MKRYPLSKNERELTQFMMDCTFKNGIRACLCRLLRDRSRDRRSRDELRRAGENPYKTGKKAGV